MRTHSLLILLLTLSVSCRQADLLPLVPQPSQVSHTSGKFTINESFLIQCPGLSKDDSLFLADYLYGKISLHSGKNVLPAETGSHIGTIRLEQSAGTEGTSFEAYSLKVSDRKILIRASGPAGIFYGINTLIQLINRGKEGCFIPGVEITDNPRFSWRGMHLDVSRHFFSVSDIKKYIDLLALHKMNIFHWHLTDDQGWRIEIKKYPELTRIGAFRIAGRDIPWDYDQQLSCDKSKDLYGGYYSQQEIRDIVKYAKERFITIVPEIEMPGHSQAALTAYPFLSCSGTPYVKNPDVSFEFTHPFCAGNDETFVFLQDVLREVFELFPSEYIHIGGDEANHSPWESCPKCQKRMHDNGLKSTAELQAWFIEKADSFIRLNGRKTIGWDEIMDGNLTREAAIMSWRSAGQTLTALSSGYKAVSTASEYLYLNRPQDIADGKPGSSLSLKEVYSFEPVDEKASPDEASRLMGINGCMWSENLPDLQSLEKHLLPRLGAIASIAWTSTGTIPFEEFEKELPAYYSFLDREGADYWIDSPKGFGDDMFFEDTYELKMQSPFPGAVVRYTLDGTEPGAASDIYRETIVMGSSGTVKSRIFLPSGRSGETRTARIIKVTLEDPEVVNALKPGLDLSVGHMALSNLDSLPTIPEWTATNSDSICIPTELKGTDNFVLIFKGYFFAPEDGIYHFYASSDDGSRFWLNGRLLIDNDGVHGYITAEGSAGLKKGYHALKIEYFDAKYGEGLRAEVRSPEYGKRTLGEGDLFR
jgi:hexosaminidase